MNPKLHEYLDELNDKRLRSYHADHGLIKEHFGIEQTVLAGGYGYRQILELIQNGADAILEGDERGVLPADGNRIQVLLRNSCLYVANTGAPLSREGLDALLRSHSSPKRGNQIGRFGLGFKSVLRLDGRIDIFTRSLGSIRFDPRRCKDELRRRFKVDSAPGLRLAWPLDESERAEDATSAEMEWAETIVRIEVRAPDILEHLRQEICNFPAEFLLFFPIPTTLVLDDGEKPSRELKIEKNGIHQVLYDGTETSRWRVVSRNLAFTDAHALADATHIHARDTVPLAWAMPLENKGEDAGRFWAFFPTHTLTHLPGILNAPWKLNSDRNAIIGGEWNSALMAEAARLIAETLPSFSSVDDPARPLDAFPRQLERKDEDAAPLVNALWKAIEGEAVIPDSLGVLRMANDLWRFPRDNAELALQWQALASADDKAGIVHPACLRPHRSSRLNALAERLGTGDDVIAPPKLRRTDYESWFKAIASVDSTIAIRVLQLAERFATDCDSAEWNTVRRHMAIIPSQAGTLLNASQLILVPDGTILPACETVASALYNDAEARRILGDVLKVRSLDDRFWDSMLNEALSVPEYPGDVSDAGWRAFWTKLRQAPTSVRDSFVERHRDAIRIRRRDGQWVLAEDVLLPGALVSAEDSSNNQNVLVDAATHSRDDKAFRALDVCEFPDGDIGMTSYSKIDGFRSPFAEWLHACRSTYEGTFRNAASWGFLFPVSLSMPKGFGFLAHLSGEPNARLTALYCARIAHGEFSRRVQFGHRSTASYPKIDVPHPLLWLLRRYGTVRIGTESVRLEAVMERRAEPALALLADWDDLKSALDGLECALPQVSIAPDGIRALWLALIAALATPSALANDTLADLWAGAAKDGVVPDSIPASSGPIPLSEVFVTTSPDLARRARTLDRLVITLDEPTLKHWLKNGALDLSKRIKPIWAKAFGPIELLTAAVPELTDVLRPEVQVTARCQPVSGLRFELDETADPVPCLMWEGTLLMDTEQLVRQSRAQRMALLVKEVALAGWLGCSPKETLQRLGDTRVDERRAKVAQEATLPERLLSAVGGRREPLLEALGALKDMSFVQECATQKLGELTLAQLGPAALSALKDTLAAEGLKPPSRWNTSEARTFVASIGFPAEFASSPEMRREAEESISGPIELPPLHDFQEDVLAGIRELIDSGSRRRRAVVSLPPGGGKTRVTVEAAVRLVLVPEIYRRSVIWIAQTDELCEQAVQAFRQVWINLGAQRTDLRIVRLWGGNPTPSIRELDRPVVVVASIQTLNSRMGVDELAWLRKPGLAVVDECHHAIAPSYSNLLRWLDAEAPRPGAPPKDEPPIVGLSATPFRTDDDESQRLARRFDNRWFPPAQEELYARLREQGVLAQADYEALASGAGLLDEEIERLDRLGEPWEGIDFENILESINQRLAGDDERNRQLTEHIQRCEERSILFFTNSVQHAEEMSARLNLASIAAAAVSGRTPTVARRYFLDRFQRGEIRVLCNHSVLTTGFDAPKTDMVFIARQVFSPVRYMQMVGRGLRGKKNGGTARCRIVTVVDNLGRFQDRHPYHYCRKYFDDQTGA